MMTDRDRGEKRILAMMREGDVLARRHSEKVKLDDPIQRGWKRHFVLTDRARNRSDRVALETILKEIDHVRYHWRPSFKDGKRGRLSWRFKSRWIEHEHRPRGICTGRWPRLKWPDAWKHYFRIETAADQWGGVGTVYRFVKEDLFRLKTERHFITELPLLNPTAIEREAEIEVWLDRFGRRWKGYKLRNGYSRWRCWKEIQEPREKYFESLSKRRIRVAMAGDAEADGGTQSSVGPASRLRLPGRKSRRSLPAAVQGLRRSRCGISSRRTTFKNKQPTTRTSGGSCPPKALDSGGSRRSRRA